MSSKIRARYLGILIKEIHGTLNSITDIHGVEVGYHTLINDSDKQTHYQTCIRTGV